MREIKFRAWDKQGEKMYPLGHLADIAYTTEFSHDWGDDLTRYQIMQYTGLKDKNGGKEIYESDILSREGDAYKVYYDEEFAAFMLTNHHTQGMQIPEDMEIVGNIYENPELLK